VAISASASAGVEHCVSVLDIFGFEDFAVNSFEQLCINYANEKLQQKFTADVFKAVEEEYREEDVSIAHVTFADNQPLLDLFEGRIGIFYLLNDECMRPSGTAQNMQAAEQASKQAAEQASCRASKQAAEQASKLPSKQASCRASKQASCRASKQAAEQASKQAAEQASKLPSKQASCRARG
jgi:hypothetical protein